MTYLSASATVRGASSTYLCSFSKTNAPASPYVQPFFVFVASTTTPFSSHKQTPDTFQPSTAGADSHSRRHIFLDNLVPLAALEGVVDCQTVRGICYVGHSSTPHTASVSQYSTSFVFLAPVQPLIQSLPSVVPVLAPLVPSHMTSYLFPPRHTSPAHGDAAC